MIDAPITVQVIAEMMFDRGLSPEDVADDAALRDRMGETLLLWRVRRSCAPTDLDAVRADLNRLCRGEAPLGRAA